jgi:hypothetical protein
MIGINNNNNNSNNKNNNNNNDDGGDNDNDGDKGYDKNILVQFNSVIICMLTEQIKGHLQYKHEQ